MWNLVLSHLVIVNYILLLAIKVTYIVFITTKKSYDDVNKIYIDVYWVYVWRGGNNLFLALKLKKL